MDSIIIQENDFQHARNRIRDARKHGKTIVFTSDDDELARKVLEKEAINVLLISQKSRKDRVKERGSGFNQVLAKLAKKKNVAIGINLDEILKAGQEEKAEMLARIRQNITICNKNKLKMTFFPELKDKYDLKSLGLVLGMPTWMVKTL